MNTFNKGMSRREMLKLMGVWAPSAPLSNQPFLCPISFRVRHISLSN